MRKAQVLVVDDETDILKLLRITLSRMDIGCRAAVDIEGPNLEILRRLVESALKLGID